MAEVVGNYDQDQFAADALYVESAETPVANHLAVWSPTQTPHRLRFARPVL